MKVFLLLKLDLIITNNNTANNNTANNNTSNNNTSNNNTANNMAEISTYEYELVKRHELYNDYMMSCIQYKHIYANNRDLHVLHEANDIKLYAKQAYELQETVVKFILSENKAFTEARNRFKDEIAAKNTTF